MKTFLALFFLSCLTAFGQASLRLQTIASNLVLTNQVTIGQTNYLDLGPLDAARIHTVKVWSGEVYDSIYYFRDGIDWDIAEGNIITGPGTLVVESRQPENPYSLVVLERIKIIRTKGSPY